MVDRVNTIATVLADIKAKHDAAVVGRSAAQGQANTAKSARAQVEASMKAIGGRVLKQCKEIKSVCSGFNVVDELIQQIQNMQMEARQTQDIRVRTQMEAVIEEVKKVCDAVKMA